MEDCFFFQFYFQKSKFNYVSIRMARHHILADVILDTCLFDTSLSTTSIIDIIFMLLIVWKLSKTFMQTVR